MVAKIDIQGGQMSFYQRIELGKILSAKDTDELDKFKQTFMLLHNLTFAELALEMTKYTAYFEEIIKGVVYWIELEKQELNYEPTTEEIQAGIIQMGKKVGNMGTIKALAKTYSQTLDNVLQWKYATVFGVLYTDAVEHKFKAKYNKLMEKKYSKK